MTTTMETSIVGTSSRPSWSPYHGEKCCAGRGVVGKRWKELEEE